MKSDIASCREVIPPFELSAETASRFFGSRVPGTLGYLLEALDDTFDSIGAIAYSTTNEIETVLGERMHPLAHSLVLLNRKVPWRRNEAIEISFYWAEASGLVLWILPPKQMYPRPVLFSSYAEFVQWLQWRLEANMNLNRDDIARLRLEIESLKAKITSPRQMPGARPANSQAMTSDLELI